MNSIVEQFSAVARANLDAQIHLMSVLASKTFDSAEQMTDMNTSLAKSWLEESSGFARKALAAKDPQALFALAVAQTQPTIGKAITYGRYLADIASAAHREFSQEAETQIAGSSRRIIELVDDLGKNAPAGSEQAIALLKTAVGNVNASYEQFSKSTRQAIEAIDTNVKSASDRFEEETTQE